MVPEDEPQSFRLNFKTKKGKRAAKETAQNDIALEKKGARGAQQNWPGFSREKSVKCEKHKKALDGTRTRATAEIFHDRSTPPPDPFFVSL